MATILTPEDTALIDALRDAGAAWRAAGEDLNAARAQCEALIGPGTAAGVSPYAIHRLTGLAPGKVSKHTSSALPPAGQRHHVWTSTREKAKLPAPEIEYAGDPTPAMRRRIEDLVTRLVTAGEAYRQAKDRSAVARYQLARALRRAEWVPISKRQLARYAGVNNNLTYWLRDAMLPPHTRHC